ncbi:enoyl-CoA hydratase/isomerase family protein [Pseudomonas saudiphocaensis]|uniref:Enoyl-CoA hydratase n=1 Tax=Pseudomonas saudiphocaensis TaxID=1499686 RepID=A0A078LXZ5_9PSED|nr:enoyl-CoA hydratase/isomerase family protein [Pseudomonas saudiphocaensis]CDZ96059.1 enoyl-CoA hydratase [Pseudomonas saudiphocaensis]
MVQNSSVVLEREGQLAHIRLARPEVLNALNTEMAEALLAACQDVASDSDVRVLLLSGEGRAFMAGGDLQDLRKDSVEAAKRILAPLQASISLLDSMQVPVVAQVHGAVAGAGLSLMMIADIVIASEDTRFSFAYSDIATSCDGGASWALPRLVGLRKSIEIAMLGEPLDPHEALKLGLLNRVVPASQLAQVTNRMVERLLTRDPFALKHLKYLLRTSLDRSLDSQLEEERDAFLQCVARPSFPVAIDRFFEARKSRREQI